MNATIRFIIILNNALIKITMSTIKEKKVKRSDVAYGSEIMPTHENNYKTSLTQSNF